MAYRQDRIRPICATKVLTKRSYFNPKGTVPKSSLLAPIVRVEDHRSGVLCCDFDPTGQYFLSGDCNGQILFHNISGSSSQTLTMPGHHGAATEVHFSTDGFNAYSCSTDGIVGIWDTARGYRKTRLEGHSAAVNSVRGARTLYPLLCSGSNDGTVKMWDGREKDCVITLKRNADVTATSFTADGEHVIFGLDGNIEICDLRTRKTVCTLRGHIGQVTGLALSPCGCYLLSHAADSTVRVWDIRPHVTFKRCVGCFPTYQRRGDGLLRCSWSPNGTKITAGTSDHDVYIWNCMSGRLLHHLPGHEASISEVVFHPTEPIVLSASKDNFLFLHEIKDKVYV